MAQNDLERLRKLSDQAKEKPALSMGIELEVYRSALQDAYEKGHLVWNTQITAGADQAEDEIISEMNK